MGIELIHEIDNALMDIACIEAICSNGAASSINLHMAYMTA